jgi:hypothetical protein
MEIVDPKGKIINISSNIEYYEGIIELYIKFKQLVQYPNRDAAFGLDSSNNKE